MYLAGSKPLTTNSLLFWPQIGVTMCKPHQYENAYQYHHGPYHAFRNPQRKNVRSYTGPGHHENKS